MANVSELAEKLKQVEIDGRRYFVAEGDLLLDDAALGEYAEGRSVGGAPSGPSPSADEDWGGGKELIVVTASGRIVRWRPGLVLTYAVERASFAKEDEYRTVVAEMKTATSDWEDCCGVRFAHEVTADTQPAAAVLFRVRKVDAHGAFIAAAFFPNDPPAQRYLNIDGSYFTTTFSREGVLRHELGHVLGFRHEHIHSGAPPECYGEDLTDTEILTLYDPRSVMHYFCGGVGSRELAITDLDREGARRVYGYPLAGFEMVE